MNMKKEAAIIVCLTAILVFSPLAGFGQAATSFSGEAVALRVNARWGSRYQQQTRDPCRLPVGI